MSGVNLNTTGSTGVPSPKDPSKSNKEHGLIAFIVKKALSCQSGGSSRNLGSVGSKELMDQFFSRSEEMSAMKTYPVFTEMRDGKINEDTLNIIFSHLNLKAEIYGNDKGKSVVEAITSEMPNHQAFKNKDEKFDYRNITVLNFHNFMNEIEKDENFEVSIPKTGKVPLKTLEKLPESEIKIENVKKLKANIEQLVEIAQEAANLLNVKKKPEENKAPSTGTASFSSSKGPSTGAPGRKEQEVHSSENRGTKKSKGPTIQTAIQENTKVAQEGTERHEAGKQLGEEFSDKKRKLEKADATYTEQVVENQKRIKSEDEKDVK